MRRLGAVKFVGSHSPQELGGNSLANTNDIDTLGFSRIILVFSRGIGAAACLTQLLQSSSTDGGTYTVMPNANVSSAVDIDGNSLSAASYTGTDATIVWDVDLTESERFIQCYVQNGSTAGHVSVYGFLCSPSNLGEDVATTYVKGQTTEGVRYARI